MCWSKKLQVLNLQFDPTAVSEHYSGKATKFHIFVGYEIQSFDMKDPTKDVKEFEETEMDMMFSNYVACRDFEMNMVFNPLQSTVFTLACICDKYRVKVRKKSHFKLLNGVLLVFEMQYCQVL